MIRLEKAGKTYPAPGGGDPVVALRDVDLEIQSGETLCLVGPSGCGKTTLLRLLNRLCEPTTGRVLVGGEDVASVDAIRLRRRMGYVLQGGGLFPHMTVRRNVGLLCELEGWPPDRIRERVDGLLEMVHLPPERFASRHPSELSGGQRQRVGVARALALEPEYLLMDEPFGALDPLTRADVQEEFLAIRRAMSKTVVIVTHDLEEAFLLGDRVGLMADARLVQLGTLADFRASPKSPYVERFLARHLDAG